MIVFVIMFLVFVGYLSYYKFMKSDKSDSKSFTFQYEGIKHINSIEYNESYKDNIFYNVINKIEFTVINDNNVGKLYIDDEKHLHISLNSSNKEVLENVKFNTLYDASMFFEKGLNAFGITEDGNLYKFVLNNDNLNELYINKIDIPNEKIVNFTNLKVKSYININHMSFVVLTAKNKLYDVYTLFPYDKDMMYINNEYILYSDMSISKINGEVFKKDNKDVKVKNIILVGMGNNISGFKNVPTEFIITSDNEMLYVEGDTIKKYNKYVSNISELENNIIVITFNDKSKIKFKGFYDKELFK